MRSPLPIWRPRSTPCVSSCSASLIRTVKNPSRDFDTRRTSLLTVCFAASRIASLVRVQSKGKNFLVEHSQVEAWLKDLPSGETDEIEHAKTQ